MAERSEEKRDGRGDDSDGEGMSEGTGGGGGARGGSVSRSDSAGEEDEGEHSHEESSDNLGSDDRHCTIGLENSRDLERVSGLGQEKERKRATVGEDREGGVFKAGGQPGNVRGAGSCPV